MSNTDVKVFEQAVILPDPDMRQRLSMLVGLDEVKEKLVKLLGLLVNPAGINAWAKKYHPSANTAINYLLRRPPLIVFAGDVGSGKSELAFTIGDAVARQEKIEITLLPLSLATRGEGRVSQPPKMLDENCKTI